MWFGMARARASACGALLRNRVWRAIESGRCLGEGVSEDAVPGSLPVHVPCRLASGLVSLGAPSVMRGGGVWSRGPLGALGLLLHIDRLHFRLRQESRSFRASFETRGRFGAAIVREAASCGRQCSAGCAMTAETAASVFLFFCFFWATRYILRHQEHKSKVQARLTGPCFRARGSVPEAGRGAQRLHAGAQGLTPGVAQRNAADLPQDARRRILRRLHVGGRWAQSSSSSMPPRPPPPGSPSAE